MYDHGRKASFVFHETNEFLNAAQVVPLQSELLT